LAYVACCSNSLPFCGIPPPFCHPIGFESYSGQPLSCTQGKRVALVRSGTTSELGRAADCQAFCCMVQTQVTVQGWLGSTPEGRRPQIRGSRTGGSLAFASSTPATPFVSPARSRELNHAPVASLSFPTDRQVLCDPHLGRPGSVVSMSIHPRTAVRCGRHAGLLLIPNCQRWSARSRHT
jgi:hypothetical protein